MKTTLIGYPRNDKNLKLVEQKLMDAKEIVISCGGGMGGCRWEEYTTADIDLNKNFISLKTNRGESDINTRNIVQIKKIKIARVTLQYIGKEHYHDSYVDYEPGEKITCNVLLKPDEKVVFVNAYTYEEFNNSYNTTRCIGGEF